MTVITLANGVVFERAEERVREYCEVEVYRDRNYRGGYDDHHSVDDTITAEDIEAANNLYARLSALDRGRITHSEEIRARLADIGDADLGGIDEQGWDDARLKIARLLSSLMALPHVKLGRATTVIHLKRPRLFPILDPFVARFLTGNDVEANVFSREELLQIGLRCFDTARRDMISNASAFLELRSALSDLPTQLTVARIYHILCWTQEKWVSLGDTAGPYGNAGRSLNQKTSGTPAQPPSEEQEPPGEIKDIRGFRQVRLRVDGVVVTTGSKPPRAHRPLCRELSEERFTDAVVFNEGKKGRYYLRKDLAEAVKDFQAVACMKCKPERPSVRSF